MSLAVLADHMASKGRGPDSMLIHMSPREVQGLQALAVQQGGSLTINPETGLPEAGFLDKLLPAIIGAGLTFFGGVPPHVSAMIVGGIQTARTGDIGKGIEAGLGAYGGANLTAGLTEAGASTIGAAEAAKGLTMSPELLAEFGGDLERGISARDLLLQQQVADKVAAATPYEKLSSGFDAFTKNPTGMAKSLAIPAAMAFGPAIMAGANVQAKGPQTVTKPGMITPYSYFGGQYVAGNPYEAAPTKSANGGLMGLAGGGMTDYDDAGMALGGVSGMGGMFDFAQRSEPVVRMARGGVAHFEEGGGVSYDYGFGGDAALAAYQSGNYEEANRLLGESGMGAQDVVDKYGLSQADAAAVAQNLGYKGDMGNIQYALPAAAAPTPTYFTQNPDVAAAFTQNSYGMTPEQFAQTHYTNYGQAEGRTMASTPVANTGGGLAALNTAATNTGANTNLNFGSGVELANTDGGLAALNTAATMPVTSTPVATAPAPVTDTGGGLAALNTAATTAATTTPYYFQVNPDVAAEYAKNNQGFSTPEAYAQAHYDKYGKKEGREFEMSAGAAFAKANNQDLVRNTQKWIDENPFATKQQIEDVIKASGMSQGDVQRSLDALVAKGELSAAERYWILNTNTGLAGLAANNMQWLKEHPNATQAEIDKVIKAAGLDRDSALLPLTHGFQVAEDKNNTAAALSYLADPKNSDVAAWLKSDQGKAYLKDHPEFDAKDIAWTHYARYGIKEGRQWGATPPVVTPPVVTPPVVTPPVATGVTPTGSYGSGPATGVDYLGRTVSIATPGDIVRNLDGTSTVLPNIPGRPAGGFTGMDQVKSRYTAGGGSLGIRPSFVPKTLAEMEGRYPLRGGSKQAYESLMGRTKYSPVPYTEDGQISKSYAESVMKLPKASSDKMYIFKDGKFVSNPDYAIPTRDKEGVLSRNVTNQDVIDYVKSPKYSDDDAFLSWMTLNNLTPDQIATAAGISVADVYKKIKKAKLVDKPADVEQQNMARGGMSNLGDYSDGGRLLRGPGDGVSDSIPATIGNKRPARLADGEFVVPARIVSELGNGSTEAGARKLYAMMDRIQKARRGTVGKGRVAKNSRSDKYLPA